MQAVSIYHQAGEKRSSSACRTRIVTVGFVASLYQHMKEKKESITIPAYFGLRKWKDRIAIS